MSEIKTVGKAYIPLDKRRSVGVVKALNKRADELMQMRYKTVGERNWAMAVMGSMFVVYGWQICPDE